MSELFKLEYAGSISWDDPVFGIEWALPVEVIAARDVAYDAFQVRL